MECDPKEVGYLRTTLYNFYTLLEGTGDSKTAAGKEFGKYLLVAHLVNMKNIYEKKGMDFLYAKVSIALLRYCDLIRLDKLYYDAGVAS